MWWGVLGAMLGWDPRPSIEQVVAYLGFLGTVGWLFLRPSRSARRRPHALTGASNTGR
jgi:high-affinity Fe2+/Pb2+ permease